MSHNTFQKKGYMESKQYFSITMNFQEIKIPPFQDILILGSKCPLGKNGISKWINLVAPVDFEITEINDFDVEAILVNKKILKRIPVSKILKILEDKIFPYITGEEIVKVDFNITTTYEEIKIDLD